MKSYSAYFVCNDNIEMLQKHFGKKVEIVENSSWIMCAYYPGDEPPDDEVLYGETSLTETLSNTLGEMIFLYGDTSTDSFVYEHSHQGVLLRKLVYFPLVDDDWNPGWICVQGTAEKWENEILFTPENLSYIIEQEKWIYEDNDQVDQFAEREAEIRRIWENFEINSGSTIPRCDGTVAIAVEKYFGINRWPA
ncbi:MAG TPA: hypothetical protein V6C58_02360 [Allocoleopsis sp.]